MDNQQTRETLREKTLRDQIMMARRARKGFRISGVSVLVFGFTFLVGILISIATFNLWWAIVFFILAIILGIMIKIASQWERTIILRLGKYNRMRGPGFFMIIPIIESIPERQARVILGESERQIAKSFEEASQTYIHNPTALHLRAMNMLFEGLKGNATIVIVPSTAIDTMNLGTVAGLTAIAEEFKQARQMLTNKG